MHPNRLPFSGVLTFVDTPSDIAPSGARGHNVVLTRAAAEEAIPSLIGMAVNYKAGWDGHNARHKCGVITEAYIEGNQIRVEGYLYERDFPELRQELETHSGKLGMSYEMADAHVADMRTKVWTLDSVTFTGAAILFKQKAAYKSTSFTIEKEPTWQKASIKSSSSGQSAKTRKSEQHKAGLLSRVFRLRPQTEKKIAAVTGSTRPNGTT